MIPQFSIRFSKTEVLNWAKRYSYADDTEVEEIGVQQADGLLHKRGLFSQSASGKHAESPDAITDAILKRMCAVRLRLP
jgi:hypothetical protein